jgi:hypothetical protein
VNGGLKPFAALKLELASDAALEPSSAKSFAMHGFFDTKRASLAPNLDSGWCHRLSRTAAAERGRGMRRKTVADGT